MNEDVEFGRQQKQKSLPYRSGATVFVPAGVPHTYSAGAGARYLISLARGRSSLIAALQADRDPAHQCEIYGRFCSELPE